MRHIALAAALAAAGLVALPVTAAFAPSAAAQGKDDDRKKEEERKRRKREADQKKREAELKAIGADFAGKSVSALLARVPKGAKVALDVGRGDEGQYSPDQARGVLKQYFERFDEIRVEFSKAVENVGSFKLTVRKQGEDASKERTLQVTIEGPDANGTITLTKLSVSA